MDKPDEFENFHQHTIWDKLLIHSNIFALNRPVGLGLNRPPNLNQPF